MKTIKYIAALAMAFALNANAAPDPKYCQVAADITGTVAEAVRAEADLVRMDGYVDVDRAYYLNKALEYGRMFAAQEREIFAKKAAISYAIAGGIAAFKGALDPAVEMYEFCMKYDRDEFMGMTLRHYDAVMAEMNEEKAK